MVPWWKWPSTEPLRAKHQAPKSQPASHLSIFKCETISGELIDWKNNNKRQDMKGRIYLPHHLTWNWLRWVKIHNIKWQNSKTTTSFCLSAINCLYVLNILPPRWGDKLLWAVLQKPGILANQLHHHHYHDHHSFVIRGCTTEKQFQPSHWRV